MLIEDYTQNSDLALALRLGAAIIETKQYRLLAETRKRISDGELVHSWWTLGDAPALNPCACILGTILDVDVTSALVADSPVVFGGYALGIEDGLDVPVLDITDRPDCFLTETLAVSLLALLVDEMALCEAAIQATTAWNAIAGERSTETPQGIHTTVEITPYAL